MARRSQPLCIAIDTGGTFTDCVWIDPGNGRIRGLKVFSTPKDPSQAIVDAIRKIAPKEPLILLHGTTVGTNTLLERKGARAALVTTEGFEDAIEIGRQARPRLYDFFFERTDPLIPKELRFEVPERTSADGKVLDAVRPEGLQRLLAEVSAAKPESVAISLLFCFANPRNEQAVADALNVLGVPLSISHQILPEFREYERTSTVVVNAYLQPVMQRYLKTLEQRAEEFSRFSASGAPRVSTRPVPRVAITERQKSKAAVPGIFVMQSSGGITAVSAAAREPVRTVLSGPAGGVVGAAAAGRASGLQNIISFDMGGTSTDVSLVEGELKGASDAHVAGFPIGVPMLDIHTVGAGGGSLVRFDAAGAMRVGPESAGADPGPICYGRGTQPTVTDANLLLGRLQSAQFLGGDFTLDAERTQRVMQEWLKKQHANLSLEEFAAGVIRVVNSSMEKAIRVVSIERGRDPRRFALVAFGGAGGLHACALADALRIPQVLVPAFPGALSALGILSSDVVKDYSRTVLWRVSGELPVPRLEQEFARLKETAARDFRGEQWSGTPAYTHGLDLRYRGQGYELNVEMSKNALRDFEIEHKRRYGHTYPGREVEIVTLRLRAVVKNSGASTPKVERNGSDRASTLPLRGMVFFDGKKIPARIYARDELRAGKKYLGPAIVTEYSATTVVPPRRVFNLDGASNLVISGR